MREGLFKGCATPTICGGPKKDLGPPKGPVLKDLGPFFCGGPGGWEGCDFHFAHLKFVWSCMWSCKQFSKIFQKNRTFLIFFRNSFRNFSKSFEFSKMFENFRNFFDIFFEIFPKILEDGVLQPPTVQLMFCWGGLRWPSVLCSLPHCRQQKTYVFHRSSPRNTTKMRQTCAN